MPDDEPMMGSGDQPYSAAADKPQMPEHVGALEALGIRLRQIERRARTEGDAYWERERSMPFEETNLAFLLRSMRSLLLILATEHSLSDELRTQAS